ncbi:MAG: type II toxin-antitoxin system RelE/ParE family toxin [Deinococcota bacterium]|jgi:mRNA interferase RelE/StbE|nr:type II toxin-antitoxin system RelE/ParE family toxin [Deinococcota bacterium]
MASYKVALKRTAIKDLRKLSKEVLLRVQHQIDGLAENPRPRGATKVRGEARMYRVLYDVKDEAQTIDVLFIRHRRDVYQKL